MVRYNEIVLEVQKFWKGGQTVKKLPKTVVVRKHKRNNKGGSTTIVKKHKRSVPDGIKSNNHSYNR